MSSTVTGGLSGGTAWVDVLPRTTGFASRLQRDVRSGLQRVSGQLRSTGGQLTRRATLPVLGFGAAILKVAGDFESSMNQVRAVTGATGEEFQRLEGLAKELGRTTQFSAAQSADAMYFLASAGFETNEVMEALPGTLQLAASAQMDLAQAADIASNILSGYGMEAGELQRVNDTLVATFQATNTNVSMLGQAMKFAAPVAKGMGIEFEEAAAALGLMGNAGIQASMAGTSMRGALTRLANPTNQIQETIERLALDIYDADGNVRSFTTVISELERTGASTADMMQIFGQRAGPAMAALTEQGADALADLTADLRESGGTAGRVADIQMEGLRGALLRMKSAAEGAAIAIADTGLLGGVADFAERAANLFQSLSEANPALLRFGVIAAGVLAAAGPVMWLLGGALGAIAALLSPAGLIIGGLALLAVGFVTAFGEGDSFAEKALDIVTRLRDKLGPALDWVGGKLQSVAEWFGITRTTAVDEVTEMHGAVVGEIRGMADDMEATLLDYRLRNHAALGDVLEDTRVWAGELRDVVVGHINDTADRAVEAAEWMAENGFITEEQALVWAGRAENVRDANIDAIEAQEEHLRAHTAVMESEVHQQVLQADRIMGYHHDIEDSTMSMAEEALRITADMRYATIAELEALAGQAGEITTEQAATVIGNSAKQRDGAIEAAEEQYRETVANIQAAYEGGTGMTAKQRDEMIEQALAQRDGTVSAARQQHQRVVDEITGMNDTVTEDVDLATGHILSSWDKLTIGVEQRLRTNVGFMAWWVSEVLSTRNEVTGHFQHLAARVGLAMGLMSKALSLHWRNIVRIAGRAVNSLTQDIINPLIRGWNRIADFVGVGTIGEIGRVTWGFAASTGGGGGFVTRHGGGEVGDGPGSRLGRAGPLRDDERWVLAQDGEWVVNRGASQRAQGLLKGINSGRIDDGFLTRAGGESDAVEQGQLMQAEDGSWVRPEFWPKFRGRAARWANQIGEAAIGRLMSVADQVRDAAGGMIERLIRPALSRAHGMRDSGGFEGLLGGLGIKAGDAVLDWVRGASEAADQAVPELGPGIGWRAMWQAVQGRFPWARLSSAYRPGAITATGNPSYHGMGRAIDVAGATSMNHPQMLRIAQWIKDNYQAQTRELIYSRGPSLINGRPWVPTGITRRNHYDHVHWAMADGGLVKRPGRFLVGEGGPEILNLDRGDMVEPLDQTGGLSPDAIREALEGMRLQVELDGDGQGVARLVERGNRRLAARR